MKSTPNMLAAFRRGVTLSNNSRRRVLLASSPRNSITLARSKSTSRNDAAPTAAATSIRKTSPSRRSPDQIARLVQARVDERDSWVGPKHPTFSEFAKVIANNFPNGLSPPIPSQEELDQVFPVQSLDWELLKNPSCTKIQCTWLGHSSLLVQMGKINILTDPVFGERASPLSFAGPKRYRPTPCSLKELTSKVDIDVVLLSHNHYDHLCYPTVKELASTLPNLEFVVPLGLASWMERWATTSHVIHELDWHESFTALSNLHISSVPMKHWSNRIGDRDKTLWCGYVLEHSLGGNKFLFPGDTAWFDGLSDCIGDQYGPFDMAAIPIGAYEPNDFMKSSHVDVEEAVRMKDAVKAKMAVPIHWGTFPLTTEPVMEPRDKLVELMQNHDDPSSLAPWLIGETRISN